MQHDWKKTKSGFKCSRCPLRKRMVTSKSGSGAIVPRFESGGGRGPVFTIHPKLPPCRAKEPFNPHRRKKIKAASLKRMKRAVRKTSARR